jgi:hypothetical protein
MNGGLEEAQVQCPYCWECFTILVDCSAGAQHYIEDCAVCCQPIMMLAEVDPSGALLSVETRRDND